MTKRAAALCFLGGVLVLLTLGAPRAAAHELTPDQLRTVRFDQQPGTRVPFDLSFGFGRAQYVEGDLAVPGR